jgi:TonB family protein
MPGAAAIDDRPAARPGGPAAARTRQEQLSSAIVFSLLLHASLVALLVTRPASKGVPKPQPRHMVMISLDSLRESGKPVAPAMELPPPPKEQPKLQPAPVPPDAQAAPKKAAPPRTAAAPQPHPPQAAPARAQVSAPIPVQKHGDEGESLGLTMLGRVRENWLRPARSASIFRCRLRIDYQAGGTISNVVLLEGCGDGGLDDSVQRAVWKTQPLPLGPAQQGPGSLVLDFTP